MKYLIILSLLIIGEFSVFAQNPVLNIDSVRDQKKQKIDSLKIRYKADTLNTGVIKKIIDEYLLIDNDSAALSFADELIGIYRTTQPPEIHNLLARTRILKFEILFRLGKEEEGFKVLEKNLENKQLISQQLLTDTYSEMSAFYSTNYQIEKAVKYARENEKIYLATDDSVGLSFTYYSIANSYLTMERMEESLEYFENAYLYCTTERFRNKAIVLMNLGLVLGDIGRYQEALNKLSLSDSIVVKHNILNIIPEINKLYGIIYYRKKDYQKSLTYCLKAIEFTKSHTIDKRYISSVNKYAGYNYYDIGQFDSAVFHLKKAMDYDLYQVDLLSAKTAKDYLLIDAYAKTEQFEEAYELLLKLSTLKDSTNAISQELKMTEVIEQYENEKKQAEIEKLQATTNLQNAQLQKQAYIITLVIVLVLLLATIVYFFYKNTLSKQVLKSTQLQLEKSQLQHRFLRTQLNPHFFFHALSSIESYLDKQDAAKAGQFLQSFSKLMRNILESSDVDFITLKEEIDLLNKYLEVQQLNFSFSFRYNINIDEKLPADRIMIPPMLLQPYVENAIVHGVSESKGGLIEIDCQRMDDLLVINITDNGKPNSDKDQSAKKLNRSMSMEILKERIQNLEKTHQFSIEIKMSHTSTGSSISLLVPLKYGNF